MTAISTQIEQLRQDMGVLAQQQLEFSKRLKAPAKNTGISKESADVIFDVVKKALDQLEAKITANHGSVHRAAINEVRDSAMAATMLGRASFVEACDSLKQSIEHVLAGTGSKA